MRKKKIIVLFIACLLLFTVVTSNTVAKHKKPKKKPTTIYVDDDYNNPKKPSDGSKQRPYTTIQQGVDTADTGDTVFVFNGNYYEYVLVDKTINLVGEDNYNTIIHGIMSNGEEGDDNVVYITADWVNMSGFNIQQYYFGIELYYSNHSTIIGNNVPKNGWASGITLWHSNKNTVTGNIISDQEESGIMVYYSSNNTISDNSVTYCHERGIFLFDSNYNTIIINKISHGTFSGISLSNSNNNIIIDNEVSYSSAGSGIEISGDNNTVTGNIVSNNDRGIVASSSNNIFYNNFITSSVLFNVYDNGNNIWNISKTPGTNIIGGACLGGNYWSDYTGIDADGDGLGDTPYIIPGGSNQDMHPLMLTITLSENKDKMINTPLLNFLERFPVLYQLLQIIYQLI